MVAEPLRQLGDGFKNLLSLSVSFCPCSGGRSSVGRAWDCDSQGRGFKPRRSPQFFHPRIPRKIKIQEAIGSPIPVGCSGVFKHRGLEGTAGVAVALLCASVALPNFSPPFQQTKSLICYLVFSEGCFGDIGSP